ncbi:Transmembrane protease serine 13 [Bulinus truncatus]|nr:Transmembrane protease serine 13 [Bulinus truncatus]
MLISSAGRFARQVGCYLEPALTPREDNVDMLKSRYLKNFKKNQVTSYNISNRYEMVTRFHFKTPCGTMEYDPAAAITDGTEAPDKAWPWQARVFSNSYTCGGVLIDANWILTAAHCVVDDTLYSIRLGSIFRWSNANRTVRTSNIKIIHENYDEVLLTNDIALIKMSSPVEFTDKVRPACLPVYGQDFVNNDFCYITGFGDTRKGPETNLHQLKVYVVPDKECYYIWKAGTRKHIDSRIICAGMVRQLGGMCHGDSGGPLSCKIGNRYYVAGVSSVGPIDCKSQFLPDRYTKVTKYIDWIFNKMNLHP